MGYTAMIDLLLATDWLDWYKPCTLLSCIVQYSWNDVITQHVNQLTDWSDYYRLYADGLYGTVDMSL